MTEGDPGKPSCRATVFAYLLALAVVAGFGAYHFRSARFHEPLGHDEWLTVEYYTWVGVHDTGEPRPIRRVGDFESLPGPSAKNLLIGFYCALGRWPEPNNHVVNSAILNLTLAWARTSAMARLPALLGAMVFGLAMFHLAWCRLRWRWAALPMLVMALGWPYTMDFAVVARGYSWSLALVALWLVLASHASRRPGSIALAAAMVVTAAASFANVVSAAVMWVAPAYLALWLVMPTDDGEREAWRRNLLIQALAIGAVGFVFMMDRLPQVFSASQQAGTPIRSWGDLFWAFGRVLLYLFPWPAWMVPGVIGLAGLIALARKAESRFVAVVALIILLFNALYLCRADRFPQARTFFQYLPLALLGVGFVIESVVALVPAATARLGATMAVGASAIALVFVAQPAQTGPQPQQWAFMATLASHPSATDATTYPLLSPSLNLATTVKTLPAAWLDVRDRVPVGSDLRVAVLVRLLKPWVVADWVGPHAQPILEHDEYRAYLIPGRTMSWPVTGEQTAGSRRLVFWYPEPETLDISGNGPPQLLRNAGVRYVTINKRRQVKMDVYEFLFVVVIAVETDAELAVVDGALNAGISKYGGTATVFVPQIPPQGSGGL